MKKGNNMPADKLTKSQGGMPKGNTPKTSRSPALGNSKKHNTSMGKGAHGNKVVASNQPMGCCK